VIEGLPARRTLAPSRLATASRAVRVDPRLVEVHHLVSPEMPDDEPCAADVGLPAVVVPPRHRFVAGPSLHAVLRDAQDVPPSWADGRREGSNFPSRRRQILERKGEPRFSHLPIATVTEASPAPFDPCSLLASLPDLPSLPASPPSPNRTLRSRNHTATPPPPPPSPRLATHPTAPTPLSPYFPSLFTFPLLPLSFHFPILNPSSFPLSPFPFLTLSQSILNLPLTLSPSTSLSRLISPTPDSSRWELGVGEMRPATTCSPPFTPGDATPARSRGCEVRPVSRAVWRPV